MDSSVSPTHGEQENGVWNGHYACTCYHPLLVFNQFGDLERCALRPGNVRSADGWDGTLKPVVMRYQGKVSRIYFRADATFAMPEWRMGLGIQRGASSRWCVLLACALQRVFLEAFLRPRLAMCAVRSEPDGSCLRCPPSLDLLSGSSLLSHLWSVPRGL